uniref:Uncharacterized protein n=1 Tax=Compsopogon caeruleus TaxID=31354 RepID=A0A7S1TAG2_9RHOD|mmetsp:Transcript_14374/g.29425  ORF Transcript_14374/g.29425 Transcript_14374/m.29425 type:complete len:731 (+) Transcript_14374:1412-3604(+)
MLCLERLGVLTIVCWDGKGRSWFDFFRSQGEGEGRVSMSSSGNGDGRPPRGNVADSFGSWGDWSKRLTESTRALSSDLLGRVDELKKTVEEAGSPASSSSMAVGGGDEVGVIDHGISREIELLRDRNKVLEEQATRLKRELDDRRKSKEAGDAAMARTDDVGFEEEVTKDQAMNLGPEERLQSRAVLAQSEEQSQSCTDSGDADATPAAGVEGLKIRLAELEEILRQREESILQKELRWKNEREAMEEAKARNSTDGKGALREILERVTKEKDAAVARLRTLEYQRDESEKEFKKIRAQQVEMERNYRNATEKIQETQNDLAKATRDVLALKKRVASADEGANRAEAKALEVMEKNKENESRIQMLMRESTKKDQEISDMRDNLARFQNELETARERAAHNATDVNAQEKELLMQLKKAREEECAARDAFHAADAKNVTLADELEKALRTVVDSCQKNVQIETKLAAALESLDKVQHVLIVTQQEYSGFRKQAELTISEKEQTLQSLSQRLLETRDTNGGASATKEEMSQLLQQLRLTEKRLLDTERQLLEQTSELRSRLESAESAARDKEQVLTELHAQLNEKTKDLAGERAKSSRSPKVDQVANLERANLAKDFDTLRSELEKLRDDREYEVSQLKSRIMSLQKELKRAGGPSFSSSETTEHPSHPPHRNTLVTGSMSRTPSRDLEQRLRGEQLEKEVWNLRKEVAHLRHQLREVQDKAETVGTLLSI